MTRFGVSDPAKIEKKKKQRELHECNRNWNELKVLIKWKLQILGCMTLLTACAALGVFATYGMDVSLKISYTPLMAAIVFILYIIIHGMIVGIIIYTFMTFIKFCDRLSELRKDETELMPSPSQVPIWKQKMVMVLERN